MVVVLSSTVIAVRVSHVGLDSVVVGRAACSSGTFVVINTSVYRVTIVAIRISAVQTGQRKMYRLRDWSREWFQFPPVQHNA